MSMGICIPMALLTPDKDICSAEAGAETFTLHGWRVIQQTGRRAWVAMPQRSWQGDDGRSRYSPVVELPAELRKRVSEAVLQQVEL